MTNDYLTKVEAKKIYLTKRRYKFEKCNWSLFLCKDEARDKYLTKRELERQFLRKNILQRHRFNQFLIGFLIALLFVLFSFYTIGIYIVLIVIVFILLENMKETKEEINEHNRTIKKEK